MSTKNNPSPHGCYERALPDEPMFVLLGRDAAAPFVVLMWCKMRELMFGEQDRATIDDAEKCSVELRDWATKLGKQDKQAIAFQAFRRACFEVAKAELEAQSEGDKGAGI